MCLPTVVLMLQFTVTLLSQVKVAIEGNLGVSNGESAMLGLQGVRSLTDCIHL